MISRKNWLFKSSVIDFYNIMIVYMNWLITDFKIDARLSTSLQDELRYIVKNNDKYKKALALQISNLFQ
jgi:DNA polymerase gamma 1